MDIIGIIGWGLNFFTWMVPSPSKAISERYKRFFARKKNTQLLESLCGSERFLDTNTILKLGYGLPYYGDNDIDRIEQDRKFFIPIPRQNNMISKTFCQSIVNSELYADTNNCFNDSFWGTKLFSDIFKKVGLSWDSKTMKELGEQAEKAATFFNDNLNCDNPKQWFNGLLYGVWSFKRSKKKDESDCVEISYFVTDYFTHLVFKYFYQANAILKTNLPQMISTDGIAFPFLTSFGVSIIAILSSNSINAPIDESDIVVIAQRSDNAMPNPGKLHFSMNEAFIPSDKIYMTVTPDFSVCASRGFIEELNWHESQGNLQFSKFMYTSFVFDAEECEMGITGLVKISPRKELLNNPKKAQEYLSDMYKKARDRELESKGLFFTSIKELPQYIAEKGKDMSSGFLNALNDLIIRYKDKNNKIIFSE